MLGTTHTQNVSRPGHRYLVKNQPYAVPTEEQYTHTKTCASSVCKNTPKNSIVRRAVTQKFTQNAQQQSLRKNKRLRGESNIKGLNKQGVNPVLTEEQESAMQD